MTLEVWRSALTAAAAGWDRQETALDTARQRLDAVEPSELGSRVAPHLTTFVTTWLTETKALHAAAADHASALRGAATAYGQVDAATVTALRRLMPWSDRAVAP